MLVLAALLPSACSPHAQAGNRISGGPEKRWAFVEVDFVFSSSGKVENAKVISSDASAPLQAKALAWVNHMYAKPPLYGRKARQTFIFDLKNGDAKRLPVAVHSGQPAAGR